MDKVTDVLVRLDLLLVIWDWHDFGLVLINPLFPNLLVSVDSLRKFFEEHSMIIVELVFGESL